MNKCIFCKIINKEISSEIVYEDEKALVFKDIKPLAPIHLLIVPKKHIPSINYVEIKDKILMGDLILIAQKIARSRKISKKGYKLVFNVEKGGGQIIPHLHLHLLGGWEKQEEIKKAKMP